MNEVRATTGPAAVSAHGPARDGRVIEAAADFEALLIAQMLRSTRSASSLTSLDGEDGGSSDAVMEFAEQQLSECLSSAGGLGLATLVTQGLSATPTESQASAEAPQNAQLTGSRSTSTLP